MCVCIGWPLREYSYTWAIGGGGGRWQTEDCGMEEGDFFSLSGINTEEGWENGCVSGDFLSYSDCQCETGCGNM